MFSWVGHAQALLHCCLIQQGQYIVLSSVGGRRWIVWQWRGIAQRRWRRPERVEILRHGSTGLRVYQSGNPGLNKGEPIPNIQSADVGFKKSAHFLTSGEQLAKICA